MHRGISFLLLLAVSLFISACGSSKDAPSSGPLTGNWVISMIESGKAAATRTQSGFLVQSADAVTGSLFITDNPCSGVGSVSGSVNGSAISLTVDPVGTSISLDGTLGSGTMSGNYTILSTGCTGGQSAPQTGTFTASLVTPLNGNIQSGSSITSNHPATGQLSVSGQISQGPNTGISSAPLTGNLSVTGYCFASANITGSISGTSVVMNLVDSDSGTPYDGVQIGQIVGVTSVDGTSVTGTYSIKIDPSLGLPTLPKPCGDGDGGTVNLML